MLIHIDVTAINGQVNATTRDALDGNILFYWLRKATTTCHVKWNCSNQLIINEILPSYAFCLDIQSALLLDCIKILKTTFHMFRLSDTDAMFKKYLSMPKGASSQVHWWHHTNLLSLSPHWMREQHMQYNTITQSTKQNNTYKTHVQNSVLECEAKVQIGTINNKFNAGKCGGGNQ